MGEKGFDNLWTASDALVPRLILVALHSIRFAAPGLAINEDSCMKSLHHLLDKIVHSHAFKDGCLVTFLIENLIKSVLLRTVRLLLVAIDADLSVVQNSQRFALDDTPLRFRLKQRSNPDCDLDVAGLHFIK